MKTKLIELGYVVVVLLVLAFCFGCKDKAESKYADVEWDCSCGEHLVGTYIKPHYMFTCTTCGEKFTNTECKTSEEYYELVGYDVIYEPNDPNVYDIIRTNQEIEALEAKIEEKDRILRELYKPNEPKGIKIYFKE